MEMKDHDKMNIKVAQPSDVFMWPISSTTLGAGNVRVRSQACLFQARVAGSKAFESKGRLAYAL